MKIVNREVLEQIDRGEMLNLELGGGDNKRTGFYNIDCVELPGVDIVADLNRPLSEIPDNSVVSLFSNHVLEHVENLVLLMEEIYRITAPGGNIEIVVPHFSNPFYYSDPTHRHPFGLYSMCYFVDSGRQPFRRKLPAYYSRARFGLDSTQLEFFRNSKFERRLSPLIENIVNGSSSRQEWYEARFCRYLSARQIRFKMTPDK